jgi:uncharacterized repeat protein (TIGR03803 family)
MKALIGRLWTLALLLLFATLLSSAQTYTVLYNLGTNAGDPINPAWVGNFTQARDGNLYSTAPFDGANLVGSVFRLTPSGTMQVLHSFNNTDGLRPNSGLTLGTDGNLYGTTFGGGLAYGTIFRISTDGTFTPLHNLNGNTEGIGPNAPPVQGNDGNYYGTVGNGNNAVFGTAYKMTPAGVFTIIHTFDNTNRYPNGLILGTDGNFYGTTTGSTGFGTIFRMTPQGNVTVLHTFSGPDGQSPSATLIQASDGSFYGTTRVGGPGNGGVVYKLTSAGVFSVVHSFANDTHGQLPIAGLTQGTDGNFYGATTTNPGVGAGAIFQITPSGTYTNLHFFVTTDGGNAQVPLYQHTTGKFYGDTAAGGSGNMGCLSCGVLYSFDMSLGPFVRLVNWSGKVGKVVEILGQGLTGTTKVTFNGTQATFSVVSDTYMTAVVPSGATSGFVNVQTPGGSRKSDRKFLVVPALLSFNPTSGLVGDPVTLTGTSFTGTRKVTFAGVSATFTVNSDTQISTTVPAGAQTGKIQVITAGGKATSATNFTVLP